jgi:LytS/YehU family sensor histidine kinase
VLVQQGKRREAESMLARLSDLLRLVVDEVHMQEVPLWRELEFLELYLSIEEVRFQDRLRVRMATEPQVSDALVPHMVLQPIAENAVRHGIGRRVGGGSIDVRASRVGGRLHIMVRDTGEGARAGAPDGHGLGLSNLRARLQQLHGSEGELRIECADTGAVVEVIVPYRRLAAPGELAMSMDGAYR